MAVYEATIENFDQLVDTDYAVVDFYGDHCGYCVMLEPIYTAASNDYRMLRFIRVNTSKYPELAQRFQIQPIPDLLFFRNGALFHRNLGYVDRESLDKHIATLLYAQEGGKEVEE